MKKIIQYSIVLIVVLAVSQVAIGQILPPPPPPPPPPGIPIDGGLTLLLAGLGAYGAKKFFGKK